MTLAHDRPYYIAYGPSEGGGTPLRLGPDKSLAVWESRDDAEIYSLRYKAALQIVQTTASRLVLAGTLVLNPAR